MRHYSINEIRQKAENLIADAGVEGIYPVPLVQILDYLGYQWIQFDPCEDTAGIAGAVDRRIQRIYTNGYDLPQRQRFTAAHEIGHIVLHEGENIVDLRVATAPSDRPELDANSFAAELVMPRQKFKELLKKKYTNSQLADFFSVSHHAVEVRKDKLAVHG